MMQMLSHCFKIAASVLSLLLAFGPLSAQDIVYTPTENNLGLTAPGGLMGFAWGDYDDDGDLDLLLCGAPSVLYRNDVSETGEFVQVSANTAEEEGIFFDVGGLSTNSSLWGDFNGDGYLDLFVATRLFTNDGAEFTFVEELLTADIASGSWGSSAADFDRDGNLDFALSGGTGPNMAGPVHIYQNDGNASLIDSKDTIIGFDLVVESWSPQWVDIDNDGFMDLWIPDIRTTEPCAILANDEVIELAYLTPDETGILAQSAIVSTWGDYNNDGYLDLFAIPFGGDADGNAKFYRNNGDRTFTDVAPDLGMDSTYTNTRGLSFGDYDNDGDLDLLLGIRNGFGQQLWQNNGDGTFTQVGPTSGLGTTIGADMRSLAFVDYDNDGFLDVYMMQNSTNPPYLFHNPGGNGNHWIVLKPKSTSNNTAAIGARVRVVAGSLGMVRAIQAGDAGGTNGAIWAHFGLGAATTVDSVIVDWPTGGRDVATNVAADAYYGFVEGQGIVSGVKDKPVSVPGAFTLYQNYPNPFNPTTTIAFSLPTRSEVRLILVNVLGKVVQEIARGKYEAGLHHVILDASNLASGLYFYKLEASGFVNAKKLVSMK